MGNIKAQNTSADKKWSRTMKKEFRRRIGFLRWLPTYTAMDAVSDLIAGVTLGLTIVPQSIAYASLARLPPRVSADMWFY